MNCKNGYLATINEIYFTYYLNGSKFCDLDSEKKLIDTKTIVSEEHYQLQKNRAKIMCDHTLSWTKANGFTGSIRKVWLTTKMSQIKKSLDRPIQIKFSDFSYDKNPSDVVVQFSDGKFLGISIKTFNSINSSALTFLNSGTKAIERDLGVDIRTKFKQLENKYVEELNLPKNLKDRKIYIRENIELQEQTKIIGISIRRNIRDDIIKELNKLSQEDAKEYILKKWLKSDEKIFPPYVRVICIGESEPFTIKIQDPIKNEKIEALNTSKIIFEEVGDLSIGIKAGDMKIFKIRLKYSSESLVGQLKFSGESWLSIDN
jgi:hypothetical protein